MDDRLGCARALRQNVSLSPTPVNAFRDQVSSGTLVNLEGCAGTSWARDKCTIAVFPQAQHAGPAVPLPPSAPCSLPLSRKGFLQGTTSALGPFQLFPRMETLKQLYSPPLLDSSSSGEFRTLGASV